MVSFKNMKKQLLDKMVEDQVKAKPLLGKKAFDTAYEVYNDGDAVEVENLLRILNFKEKQSNHKTLNRNRLRKGDYFAIIWSRNRENEEKVRKMFELKKDDFIDDEMMEEVINVENINKSLAFKIIRTKTEYGMNKNAINMFINEKMVSFKECIKHYENHLKAETKRGIAEYGLTKINIIAKVRVYNEHRYVTEAKLVKLFDKSILMKNNFDVDEVFNNFVNKFSLEFVETMTKLVGSGWSYLGCDEIDINFFRAKQTKAGSFIESPKWAGRGLINIKNDDEMCFKYCVNYHFKSKTEKKHLERVAVLKKVDHFNFDKIDFPCSLESIKIFEKKNKGISINVFYEDAGIIKVAYSSNNKTDDVCNLFLITDGEKNHYCYVKNMGTMRNKLETGNDHKIICEKCTMQYDKRYNHKCSEKEHKTEIEFIENGSINNLKIAKMLNHPFVCYFDFESSIEKTDDEKKNKHVVNSYAYKIICNFDEKLNSELILYRGENACKKFIDAVCKEQKKIEKIIRKRREKYEDHNLSKDEETEFRKAKNCYLCDCKIKGENKIREHCHLTGKYRGASCNDCNLKNINKNENKLICMSHNLNYDGAFILADAQDFTDNIDIISTTEEKFMCFEFCKLVFKDTFKFLTMSLESLVEIQDKNNLKFTKAFYDDKFEIAMRKGVYPYEWVDNMKKFECKGLPNYENFYSSLRNGNVDQNDYEYAKKSYELLKCKNFGDYHDHYLRLDVLLLCDVFENFRKKCKEDLKVDPCNYVSIASVAYDAFLLNMKKNNKDVKTVENNDVKEFYERHKLGAICQVMGKKHVKANNKYMGSEYDAKKESNFILYIDANNLYGWAMSQKLPNKILGKENITMNQIRNLKDEGDYGYTVCCDLSFPKEFHDKFNGYVPAPVRRAIDKNEISNYQREILKTNDVKNKDKSLKVILDLNEKKEYIVDFRLLKLYEKMGVIVDKIHYGYKYEMDYVIKDYIEMNTKKRAESKNEFDKAYYKLLNNIIYGKMLQDVMGQNDTCLTKDDRKAQKMIGYNTFKDLSYQNGFYTIQMEKEKVVYNKATYLGTTILDLSKYLMYDFHYNVMKPKYGNKCEMIYTDTDSFVYDIKTDDLYSEMFEMKEYFDLSDVKIDKFKSNENKKVIGKFKDESEMIPITEFVALKPKLYSFLVHGEDKKHLKAKGITRGAQKDMKHEMFTECARSCKDVDIKQVRIQMFKRQVYTLETSKKGLSNYDDKMYRLNNYEAYSYGHYKIKN